MLCYEKIHLNKKPGPPGKKKENILSPCFTITWLLLTHYFCFFEIRNILVRSKKCG